MLHWPVGLEHDQQALSANFTLVRLVSRDREGIDAYKGSDFVLIKSLDLLYCYSRFSGPQPSSVWEA